MTVRSFRHLNSLDDLPISSEHRLRLRWFLENEGSIVPFNAFSEFVDPGLLTKAKGIYKPKNWEFALSIRQSLASQYGDLPFVTAPDGSWVYRYHRENGQNLYTNNGLLRCMAVGIPVGVIVQLSPKPNATYWIAGLGMIKQFHDPWFDLVQWQSNATDLEFTRLVAEAPEVYEVGRETISQLTLVDIGEDKYAEQLVRPNQHLFRAMLLNSYDRTCAVTKSHVVPALEAAHIRPFSYERIDKVQNGLLLRADVHRLFDRGFIGVNTSHMETVISPRLIGSEYEEYAGQPLLLPQDSNFLPAIEYLDEHRKGWQLT